mmetsp:Transcript_55161/g.64533  ORF Transcript_55161/g.64533 Transcript_55161/m.64533 type:complete len:178 (-) Transcript_55161:447-980(-)
MRCSLDQQQSNNNSRLHDKAPMMHLFQTLLVIVGVVLHLPPSVANASNADPLPFVNNNKTSNVTPFCLYAVGSAPQHLLPNECTTLYLNVLSPGSLASPWGGDDPVTLPEPQGVRSVWLSTAENNLNFVKELVLFDGDVCPKTALGSFPLYYKYYFNLFNHQPSGNQLSVKPCDLSR